MVSSALYLTLLGGWVLAVSQIPVVSGSEPQFVVYAEGMTCGGFAMGKVIRDLSVSDCQARCLATPTCQAVVFRQTRRTRCWLKASVCMRPIPKAGFTVYSLDTSQGALSTMESMFLSGWTCEGAGYEEVQGNGPTCSQACMADPQCAGYSIFYSPSLHCKLQTEMCGTPTRVSGAAGVYIKTDIPKGYEKNTGGLQVARHKVIASFSGLSLKDCAAQCDASAECKVFEHIQILSGADASEDNCFTGSGSLEGQHAYINGRNVFEKIPAPRYFTMVHSPGSDCPKEATIKSAKRPSLDLCAVMCKRNADCAGFVWDQSVQYGKNCYLKSAICDQPTPNAGHMVFQRA